MPLQATSGAASYDAFGGGVPVEPVYIEQIFSTYLYTGNGSTQTITNNIDLSTKGGLVWLKSRSANSQHNLLDTARGVNKTLYTSSVAGQSTDTDTLNPFNTNGFTLGAGTSTGGSNTNAATYASWTFRKQSKFFDVVTYTGTGANRTIAHNLGSAPGCMIVKRTDAGSSSWAVYHRSLTSAAYGIYLNTTDVEALSTFLWNSTAPTSTVFSVGTGGDVNTSGGTYIAYLFAHNAGGFGLTGTDNVISCGSYVGTGVVGNAVTLGYEPQWLMVKNITSAFDWIMYDNMRGMPASATNTGNTKILLPNTSAVESGGGTIIPTATGFQTNTTYAGANFSGDTYIYIAIRRGPMKVPTTGTSVFAPSVRASGTGAAVSTTGVGFPPDLLISTERTTGVLFAKGWHDRLRGNVILISNSTNNEAADSTGVTAYGQDGFSFGADGGFATVNYSGSNYVYESFRRAPSFFDEVCYTGTGSATTQAHNLGVVPELMIIKSRGTAGTNWAVYSQLTPTTYRYNTLQTNSAGTGGKTYGPGGSPNFEELSAQPTSTVINLASSAESNASGRTFVAYLFATCAGVSKVGSYTGNGSSQTINCGFTGGARFVLIKATSTTGDWMVSDSARGIIAGSDPYLELNNTNAEVTGEDWLDTDSTGFVVNEVSGSNANTNGVSYIFLAIA